MIKIPSETSLHNVLREAGIWGYRHRDIDGHLALLSG